MEATIEVCRDGLLRDEDNAPVYLDLSQSRKEPVDDKILLRVEKLLKLNASSGRASTESESLISRALAEVELAKSSSPFVGTQKDQEMALSRMGIRFSASGTVEKPGISPNRNASKRFTKGNQERL